MEAERKLVEANIAKVEAEIKQIEAVTRRTDAQTEAIKVLARQAAWARAEGRDVRRLAAIAKLAACDVFREVAAKGVQIHGGVGFTAEENPQLYFRRAKQMQLSWWGSSFLEERIAASLLD